METTSEHMKRERERLALKTWSLWRLSDWAALMIDTVSKTITHNSNNKCLRESSLCVSEIHVTEFVHVCVNLNGSFSD